MVNDRVVYVHRNKSNNEVFYVGMGNPKRPGSKNYRNKYWIEYTSKNDYEVEIIASNLTSDLALELEEQLISDYGLDSLTNILPSSDSNYWAYRDKEENEQLKAQISATLRGNTNANKKCYCIETGAIYESIRDAAKSLGLSYNQLYKRISGRTSIPTTIRLYTDDNTNNRHETFKGIL